MELLKRHPGLYSGASLLCRSRFIRQVDYKKTLQIDFILTVSFFIQELTLMTGILESARTGTDMVSRIRGENMTMLTTKRNMTANGGCFQKSQFGNNLYRGPLYSVV